MSITLALTLAIVLVLLAIAAINIAGTAPWHNTVRRKRHSGPRATGLPAGEIVYMDADGTAEPLAAWRYPLTGKPDYVVRTPAGSYVPVEIKSARIGSEPRHEDVLQVVAYMITLEDLYAAAPRYGLLRYANATVEVPYTTALRDEVLALLAELQALDAADPTGQHAPAGTPSAALCRGCAFKSICEDALL